MDPKVVLVLTYVTAGVVVAAYIWFVVWRIRVERRKKAAQAETDSAMSSAIARAAEQTKIPPRIEPATVPDRAAAVATTPVAPVETSATELTIAVALTGISLPNDLAPLTTMIARPGVGDRVAFWTNTAPAEIVGPAFADELERLGYTVTPLDDRSLDVQRGGERLVVMIHPNGPAALIGDKRAFESVPELSLVIEVWVPSS
jgi:hypothetical protein